MRITFKLYASLAEYLPADCRDNTTSVEIEPGMPAHAVLDRFKVPRERAHLVLLNGVYLNSSDRNLRWLKEGDVLAAWPPTAGG